MAREGLSKSLGLPIDRVRVRPAPIGGAFGGKLMISEPLAAAAALKLRRPVRLVFGRSEDFAAANPAPGELIDLELGATRDGKLTAIRGRVVGDRGGLGDMGVEIDLDDALGRPVQVARARPDRARRRHQPRSARARTARPARRRPRSRSSRCSTGSPPSCGLDPIELRLRNVITAGDRGLDGQEFKSFGARECLERVREHPLWQRRDELPDGEGVGVALGFWPGGLEPAAAICRLDADGRLTVVTAAADMSGIENAFVTIAAETFGLAEDSVRVATGDTSSARPTAASAAAARSRTRSAARSSARPRPRARSCSTSRPRSWRSRPRTSSWSTARCARSARPAAPSRSPS